MKLNPFIITGYKSPEYFCELHVFDHFPKDSGYIPVYFDIMGTTRFDEFAGVFCNAVLQSISKSEWIWKGFLNNDLGKLSVQDKFFTQWIRTKKV